MFGRLLLPVVCFALPLFAQPNPPQREEQKPPPPLLSFIGATTRLIDKGPVEIPVTWVSEHVPAARVRQVMRGGVELNPDAFRITPTVRDRDHLLVVQANPNLSAEAGKYEIDFVLTPAPADAEKVANAPVPLKLTLTRNAPVIGHGKLEIISPLSVERIIMTPWSTPEVEPKEWIIAESGGEAGVQVSPAQIAAPIITADPGSRGQLKVSFDSLAPNGQGVAKLGLSGTEPWVGQGTARMLVHAPTFTKTPVVYMVPVKSRLSYIWLVAAILAGVGLGYFVKKWLEGRGQLLGSRLAGEQLRLQVVDYEARITDSEVRGGLRAQRERLVAALARTRIAKETLDAIVKEVQTQTAAIVKKAEEDRAKTKEKVSAIRAAIGRADEQDSPLDAIVKGVSDTLAAQVSLLEVGQIGAPARELARVENDLPAKVSKEVAPWRARIGTALFRFGDWSELPPVSKSLARIQTALDSITLPHTLDEVAKTLAATAVVTNELRNELSRGLPLIQKVLRQALTDMERVSGHDAERGALKRAEEELSRRYNLPAELELAADAVERAQKALKNARAATQTKAVAPAALPSVLRSPREVEMLEELAPMSAPSRVEGEPIDFRAFDAGVQPLPSEDTLTHEIAFTHAQRDAVTALLIVIAGVIIFRTNFIGSLEDLFGAILWGFSIDLTAATLTQYAAPLVGKKPYK
ncbi:MAG TPA: hypothetical protein VF911_22005 [Thermoanaerobaculia bacterium]